MKITRFLKKLINYILILLFYYFSNIYFKLIKNLGYLRIIL